MYVIGYVEYLAAVETRYDHKVKTMVVCLEKLGLTEAARHPNVDIVYLVEGDVGAQQGKFNVTNVQLVAYATAETGILRYTEKRIENFAQMVSHNVIETQEILYLFDR